MGDGTVSIRLLARCALAAALLITPTLPAFAGGVAILNTVLTDNGDDDGYVDTREKISMRLTVQNTSGVPLSDVSLRLINEYPASTCLTGASVSVGDLAPGEVKLTDEFEFYVGNLDRTTLGLGKHDQLLAGFSVSIDSQPGGQPAHPSRIVLDLDLDVANGSGPSTFLEHFEDDTLGSFEIDNIDAGKHSLEASDGHRCQYSDPDWVNSASYGHPSTADVCMLGNTPAHADATFWGLSGPTFSPLGGRGFTGFHSMFFGIDLGPPNNWTTPLSVMEASKTIDPIHLGWNSVAPVLSFMHQVSLVDFRTFSMFLEDGESIDRGIVMAQLADEDGQPAAPWLKLEPYQNVYTSVANVDFNCSFDPIDDGSTEDDFFDPSDPDRVFGPSSTCIPELIYTHVGETSNPFAATNVGSVDGPGLAGVWGIGTWIESKFDLSRFRGRSVRLRYLYSALQLGDEDTLHWEAWGLGDFHGDDGWWIDDVTVTDTLSTSADVSTDDKDNSSLPEPPGGDTDSDGILDVCDNCAVGVNPDQEDVDLDGLGDLCDPCPVHPFVEDHDSDGLCAEQDNCPFDANPGQANGDGDPAGTACDCDDTDPATYPGAEEVNDGVDNNCPGDIGYGVADETSGESGFYNPNDKNEYSWPAQPGAARYEVARADTADFSVGCTIFGPMGQTFLVDVEPVASGETRYYMNRSTLPNLGSWGQDSAEVERTVPCD